MLYHIVSLLRLATRTRRLETRLTRVRTHCTEGSILGRFFADIAARNFYMYILPNNPAIQYHFMSRQPSINLLETIMFWSTLLVLIRSPASSVVMQCWISEASLVRLLSYCATASIILISEVN